MLLKILSFFFCLSIFAPLSSTDIDSRGKQQKYFPKVLKKKGVYLGMSAEKFLKEVPEATLVEGRSEFKIEYIESSQIPGIESYSYLLTQTSEPQLYSITIAYTEMEGVQSHAELLMGAPNYNGEWRMQPSEIKEDFMMGAWTFGHKLVYGATILNSEWEKGFQN